MKNIEVFIGINVKEARIRANLTQSELADAAKTSLTTINRLEKGRQLPHSETLSEIAKALNVTVSELYLDPHTPRQADHSNKSKAQVLGELALLLPTLDDSQLRTVLSLVEGYGATSTSVVDLKKINR